MIRVTVNGYERSWDAGPGDTLLEVLRREGFAGVKKGCGTGDCGACTVLLNGRAVNACLVLAAKADGGAIMTIEGVADGERLHPVQEAFLDAGAVQCGYCTPGMVLSAVALLSRNADPTEAEIREAISGNLCRCTGYVKQVEAIQRAAARIRGER
ncbi:MAG: (2Fe-2S)-binding protein [Candidatus Bipolaricaulota bacterium]|nr:(2Fe-2S)-binding protein [Candidatus Bipolaricaulota bacterium]